MIAAVTATPPGRHDHDMDHIMPLTLLPSSKRWLKNAQRIGHSTGGEELRYVCKVRPAGRPRSQGRSGIGRSAADGQDRRQPRGLPIEVFDGFRAALAANRAQFFRDVPAGPFYGFNRDSAKVQESVIQNW